MEKKYIFPLVISGIVFAGVLAALAFTQSPWFAGKMTPPKACTMEAMLCPDGSAVGRSGPHCEFDPCPPATPAPNELSQSYEDDYIAFNHPENWEMVESVPVEFRDKVFFGECAGPVLYNESVQSVIVFDRQSDQDTLCWEEAETKRLSTRPLPNTDMQVIAHQWEDKYLSILAKPIASATYLENISAALSTNEAGYIAADHDFDLILQSLKIK